MNKLSTKARAQILEMMVEGVSIRAISRMTGASKNTVAKLLEDAGEVCAQFHDENVRNVPCKRVQCDEIWSFVRSKQRNTSKEDIEAGEAGDTYTWTAIDADSKLIVSWLVGHRDSATGIDFMRDLASRLRDRIQLTTDAFRPYRSLVGDTFKGDVDYAMLIKEYGSNPEAGRYSPASITRIHKRILKGNPDPEHVSTSFVELQNLTMRMSMRRFTRLTNGFSKKVENHVHALAIYFMHYNFIRTHQTLRVTPAMEADLSKSPMTWEQVLALVDAANPMPKQRGPYQKKLD